MNGARAILIVLGVLLAGCVPSPPSAQPSAGQPPAAAPRTSRITIGIRAELPTVSKTLNTIIPGATGLDRLVSAGLTTTDDRGVLHPQLAEAVPSLENGQWKLLPDGAMETTWRLRPNVKWHDGAPITPDDIAFGVRVGQDRELPLFNHSSLGALDRLRA